MVLTQIQKRIFFFTLDMCFLNINKCTYFYALKYIYTYTIWFFQNYVYKKDVYNNDALLHLTCYMLGILSGFLFYQIQKRIFFFMLFYFFYNYTTSNVFLLEILTVFLSLSHTSILLFCMSIFFNTLFFFPHTHHCTKQLLFLSKNFQNN